LLRVITGDLGLYMIGGEEALWMMTYQVHSVNAQKNR
jgi:hypothetical protein